MHGGGVSERTCERGRLFTQVRRCEAPSAGRQGPDSLRESRMRFARTPVRFSEPPPSGQAPPVPPPRERCRGETTGFLRRPGRRLVRRSQATLERTHRRYEARWPRRQTASARTAGRPIQRGPAGMSFAPFSPHIRGKSSTFTGSPRYSRVGLRRAVHAQEHQGGSGGHRL